MSSCTRTSLVPSPPGSNTRHRDSDEAPDHLAATPPEYTANMSDDEERVTMPFKFVTGMFASEQSHAQDLC